jgi:3D (Asp-Asp-Asp) domain-containing protein
LNAVFSLWLRKFRVHLVLIGWLLPGMLVRLAARLRSGLPVAKTLAVLALAAAIVAPSHLFLKERARRIELASSYYHLNVSSSSEISTLKYTLGALMDEQAELRALLLDSGRPVISGGELAIQLIATGYSSSICETDNTPFITASNTRTRPGIVALSRDLLTRYDAQAPFNFGDAVHITGMGDFVVEDSMHRRWNRRLDFWFPSRSSARKFGIRKIVITKPIERTVNKASEQAYVGGAGVELAMNTALAR